MIKNADDLKEKVLENFTVIIEHADKIREASRTTTVLMVKVVGAVKEVQKQGQEASNKFESLKALIKS